MVASRITRREEGGRECLACLVVKGRRTDVFFFFHESIHFRLLGGVVEGFACCCVVDMWFCGEFFWGKGLVNSSCGVFHALILSTRYSCILRGGATGLLVGGGLDAFDVF